MRNTIIMLAAIGTFAATWLLVAAIAYLLSDIADFKSCANNGGTMMFMLLFGWIPCVLIGTDLFEYLENK
jgi:hypothetical protein